MGKIHNGKSTTTTTNFYRTGIPNSSVGYSRFLAMNYNMLKQVPFYIRSTNQNNRDYFLHK